jgi:rhodanese-related sulfurtransferase|tara:strand:+ start:361 stop:738 length:378 start_codon:yes stop_codon:yes gene_type:complete
MIKQIPSNEVEVYIKNNPKSILLDVRTEEEWSADGKPDGEKISLQTHFLTIQLADGSFNENFISDFKKLSIEKDHEILTMCMGGVRSQAAAELLTKENYNCSNISDGFLGNTMSPGWKQSGLPCK